MSRPSARKRTSQAPKSAPRAVPATSGAAEWNEHRGITGLRNAEHGTVGGRLRELLTWGLHTDDTPEEDGGGRDGCGYEAVLRKAAVVQLKAIAIALVNGGEDHRDGDPDHHLLGLSFNQADAAEALAGVAAMLEHAGDLIGAVRDADALNAEARESAVAS
jgi:hypothetical protein